MRQSLSSAEKHIDEYAQQSLYLKLEDEWSEQKLNHQTMSISLSYSGSTYIQSSV